MSEQIETEETEELIFKRFPEDKQEQVRGLVNYATLMGLDGKDLVSIGNRLNRIRDRREIESNRAIVEAMDLRTIGKDSNLRHRWAYKTNGVLYYFSEADWYGVKIKNCATNRSKHFRVTDSYNLGPRFKYRENMFLADVMLNVYHGNILLNF